MRSLWSPSAPASRLPMLCMRVALVARPLERRSRPARPRTTALASSRSRSVRRPRRKPRRSPSSTRSGSRSPRSTPASPSSTSSCRRPRRGSRRSSPRRSGSRRATRSSRARSTAPRPSSTAPGTTSRSRRPSSTGRHGAGSTYDIVLAAPPDELVQQEKYLDHVSDERDDVVQRVETPPRAARDPAPRASRREKAKADQAAAEAQAVRDELTGLRDRDRAGTRRGGRSRSRPRRTSSRASRPRRPTSRPSSRRSRPRPTASPPRGDRRGAGGVVAGDLCDRTPNTIDLDHHVWRWSPSRHPAGRSPGLAPGVRPRRRRPAYLVRPVAGRRGHHAVGADDHRAGRRTRVR